MGCVSPVPFMNETFMQTVEEKIIKPTVNGLAKENVTYHGFIFFGLMNVNGEPFLIEYNCRMGDPETEVVMPRLQTDLIALFAAMDNGTLVDTNISFDERACAAVVAVSGGYPGEYRKNFMISGLADWKMDNQSIVFHAGTKQTGDAVVTNGGRVLAITSYGNTIAEAAARSKKVLEKISFQGMYFRKDIGYEF